VIELLLQTGMRLSDVSRIKVTDASLPTRIAKEPGSAGAAHILGKGPLHRVLVAKYLAAAGIHGASVHTLRHPFGTTRSSRCTKLRVAREVLGHRSWRRPRFLCRTGREDMDRQLQENALQAGAAILNSNVHRWLTGCVMADRSSPRQRGPPADGCRVNHL
jgi:hypothetical protein